MADVETPRVTPGLSPRSIRAFDAMVEKHTTALRVSWFLVVTFAYLAVIVWVIINLVQAVMA